MLTGPTWTVGASRPKTLSETLPGVGTTGLGLARMATMQGAYTAPQGLPSRDSRDAFTQWQCAHPGRTAQSAEVTAIHGSACQSGLVLVRTASASGRGAVSRGRYVPAMRPARAIKSASFVSDTSAYPRSWRRQSTTWKPRDVSCEGPDDPEGE